VIEPEFISAAEQRARLRRVSEIANALGFVGEVEYRHVYSRSGGAQYCIGTTADNDIIIVYAEAIERDADPEDFSLESLIAHECGHQKLIRNASLQAVMKKFPGEAMEEILASLVGSVLLGEAESAQALVWKAAAELSELGMPETSVVDFVERLRRLLEQVL
jgi:hypothetical protein